MHKKLTVSAVMFNQQDQNTCLASSCPFISVIIPVYNDAECLKHCLQALEGQTYPKACYEVIVVDNGSDESIEPLMAQFPQAKAAYEAQPGAYAARNTGISMSTGEILSFTDSDCIPASDWLERGVRRLMGVKNCGLLGGKVELFFRITDRPTAVELFDDIVMNFDQQANIEKNFFSVTANLFTFRSVVDDIGGFDPKLKSRGDVEWGRRVAAQGYALVYADEACVAHPARHSVWQLCRRVRRLTGGFEELSRKDNRNLLEQETQEFSLSLSPSFFTLQKVWSTQHISLSQKFQVTLIGMIVKFIKLQERARLKLWGSAVR